MRKELRNGVPVVLDESGRVVEFWIRRENWARQRYGALHDAFVTSLLVDDKDHEYHGMSCCQGHYSFACGLRPCDVANVSCVESLGDDMDLPEQLQWMTDGEELIDLNDGGGPCRDITDSERERKITIVFDDHGITVHFCDGIPDESKELAV